MLRRIRAHEKLRKLIVVILTSSNTDADIEAAYEPGANSFLIKPSGNEEREALMKLVQCYWLETNKPAATL